MHEPPPEGRPLRVGYVLKKFPRLSETFILNEILGLQAAGVEVAVHSLRFPDEGRYHADLGRLRGEVEYLPSLGRSSAYEAFRALAEPPGLRDPERFFGLLERLPERRRGGLVVQAMHLVRSVRRRRLRHLHAHFMTVAARAACLAHFATGVPFTVTAHAKDIFRETVDPAVFGLVARAAARVVTVTGYNRRFIAERFLGGDDSSVTRIYNGIPLCEIEPGPRERPAEPLVLAVGRLVEKKGFHVLLEACRILADSGEPVPVEILGEGEERARLEEARTRLGLERLVSLPGAAPRETVLERMRRARVLAAPCLTGRDGNRDALPTVVLEALAVGLPAVATRINGIPEIVEHGRDGWLVEEGDAPALAEGIRRLVHDHALWRRLSRAGRPKVAERFDRDRTLPELIEVFLRSAAADAPAPTARA